MFVCKSCEQEHEESHFGRYCDDCCDAEYCEETLICKLCKDCTDKTC